MSLPQSEQNGVFTHIKPGVDLGLRSTLALNATAVGTNFNTGAPCTVVSLCRLNSGTAVVNLEVNNGTPTGIPTRQCIIPGTSRQFEAVRSVFGQLYCQVTQIATAAAGFEEMAVVAMYELEPGEDWFNIRSGSVAVMNSYTGDGTGWVNLFFA